MTLNVPNNNEEQVQETEIKLVIFKSLVLRVERSRVIKKGKILLKINPAINSVGMINPDQMHKN